MANNTIDNNKLIAKNTAFLYIRMFVVLVITLYTSRVVLRTLGVTDYGVYNVVGSLATMFSFLNSSLSGAAQRFYNYERSSGGRSMRQVFLTALSISAILSIILLTLMEACGVPYIQHVMVLPEGRMGAAHWVYQFSCLCLIVTIMEVPFTAVLLANEKMNFYAVVTVIETLCRLGLVVMLPKVPADKLVVYAGMNLFLASLSAVLYAVYAYKVEPGLHDRGKVDKSLFKEMFGYSGWNIAGSFAFLMKGQGVNMLLNEFFGVVVNTARGVSYQVLSAMKGFTSNISIAFRPQLISAYAAGDIERTRKLVYSQTKICYMLACTMIVPLILEVQYILELWLGKDVVPEYAAPFTALVMIDMLLGTLNAPLTQVSYATGKVKVYQIVATVTHMAIIPIAWLLLWMGYSPVSAFVVCIVMTIVNQIADVFVIRQIFPLKVRCYLRTIIIPCLVFTALLPLLPLLVRELLPVSFWRLLAVTLIDVAIAIGIGYAIMLDKNERDMIIALLPKKVRARLSSPKQ